VERCMNQKTILMKIIHVIAFISTFYFCTVLLYITRIGPWKFYFLGFYLWHWILVFPPLPNAQLANNKIQNWACTVACSDRGAHFPVEDWSLYTFFYWHRAYPYGWLCTSCIHVFAQELLADLALSSPLLLDL
jgi:hypothetical protein